GVDELIRVVAATEHGDVAPLLHPVEEYLKDSETAVAEDGPGPNDRRVQAVVPHEALHELLARELGASVGLARLRLGLLVHRIALRHTEDGARRGMHHLAHARRKGRAQQ